MDTAPDCQTIENAYVAPEKMLATLPDSAERDSAVHYLDMSRQAAYDAREKTRDKDAGS